LVTVSKTRSSSLQVKRPKAADAPSTSTGVPTPQVHTVQTRVAGDPTTQVHNVQTRVTGLAVHSTPAVTVMSAPLAANAPVLTPENGPHVADVQRAEHDSIPAVTEHGSD
jgi:hypothetical protein